MKKLLVFLSFFTIIVFNLEAQPSSSAYLIETVYSDFIEKKGGVYEVDSSFLLELLSLAYPNNWQTPIKRNLDLYGFEVMGSYRFFLTKAYQENGLAIGLGHYFNEEGEKQNFSIIFGLDKSQENYYFVYFCQSGENLPSWEFIGPYQIKCLNGQSTMIKAGQRNSDLKPFY